jgi:hypothetical protein
MMDLDAHDKRIAAILGDPDDLTFDQAIGVFCEYLKTNLTLPCEVTGTEDFRWEEIYVFGPGDQEEYERLKKTQPSYSDHYELLGIVRKGTPEWMLFWQDDIGANVRRISDGREFLLGLSELKATDKKSGDYQLLEDYSVWFVNNR